MWYVWSDVGLNMFFGSLLFVLKSGARERTLSAFVLFWWIAAGGLLQVAAYSLFRWQWRSRGAAAFINHLTTTCVRRHATQSN